VARLAQAIPRLAESLPLERVVLFGSYATGRQTAASDLDVLVIYRGGPRVDAYQTVRRALGLPGVEPHVYTLEEARQLAPTLERMTRDGVTLYPC